jgi:hypothetical protein
MKDFSGWDDNHCNNCGIYSKCFWNAKKENKIPDCDKCHSTTIPIEEVTFEDNDGRCPFTRDIRRN